MRFGELSRLTRLARSKKVPHPPSAELVRLSDTIITDEMREERRRRVLGE
jgi:hypothetical protein